MCKSTEPLPRRMQPLLGCFVEIGADVPGALDAGFAAIAQAQARWSFQDPASELSQLNRRPGQAVAVSLASWRLLRLARGLMQRSHGLFDCTLGGALVLAGHLPRHDPASMPLPKGLAEDIELDPARRWARLRRPILLTLDGIAKGYAVDLGLAALRHAGARAGWVNAGGDLRVFGELGLPVRRRELGGHFSELGQLRNAAIASSAVQERPGASFPARILGAGLAAPAAGVWSVLARSAWRADGLTKVAANASVETRAAVVASLGGQLLEPVAKFQAKATSPPAAPWPRATSANADAPRRA